MSLTSRLADYSISQKISFTKSLITHLLSLFSFLITHYSSLITLSKLLITHFSLLIICYSLTVYHSQFMIHLFLVTRRRCATPGSSTTSITSTASSTSSLNSRRSSGTASTSLHSTSTRSSSLRGREEEEDGRCRNIPRRRLESLLDKYCKIVFPFYIHILTCHQQNIEKVTFSFLYFLSINHSSLTQ